MASCGDRGRECAEHGGYQAQNVPEPVEQEREVVANGSQNGIDCISLFSGEIIAIHPMLVLDVADDGLDG